MDMDSMEIQEQKPYYGTFLYKDECYRIQGAIFEVYRELGCGFIESVYQVCLEDEFLRQGIPFKSKVQLPILYKGRPMNQIFVPDLICFDLIILELKATKEISDDFRAQLINYLKASGLKVGLLVNFGHYPKVAIERMAL